MIFNKLFLLFSICSDYKDPIKSPFLECSKNSKSSNFSYLRSIPEDPIKYFKFNFATEKEKTLNDKRRVKSVISRFDSTKETYKNDEKIHIEKNVAVCPSAFFQLLMKRSLSFMGKSQLYNMEKIKLYVERTRDYVLGSAYFNTVWLKESRLKELSFIYNCKVALHELHHIIHGDHVDHELYHIIRRALPVDHGFYHIATRVHANDEDIYGEFYDNLYYNDFSFDNNKLIQYKSFSNYIEYSADLGALEYMGSAEAINKLAEQYHDNYTSSKGYLNKKQVEEFAKEAQKQEDQFKANFSYNDMILKQKEFTKDDLNQFKFSKTTKQELLQDQQEHEAYIKNLRSDNDTKNEFQAVNDHKMTMLLAIQKKLHIEMQLLNNKLKNNLYIKLLHLNSILEDQAYINPRMYSNEFYHNITSYIDKNDKLKNNLYTKLLHLNSMLEEQAYINARVYSDQFQCQYPSNVNAEELKKRSFNDLKGNQDKSERSLLSNLFAVLQYDNLDKLKVNFNWVELEIEKAKLERNQEKVEQLECIKANYQEQIENLKGN